MTKDESTAFWMAWGSYLEHVQPHGGEPCAGCLEGSHPREGCEEGQRLWDHYQSLKKPGVTAV
ncbi:hypothetical protein SEA_IBANTIK_1 [Streptomyces phage Ibantik]|uniref:Uncharacterized protein n=1 Tax=Streptomyces phage Ibantik TaxID=2182397 RepID=A0A2U8UP82_9CAUD|nr:hypothetical protein QEH36_gp001 [Streptomyces phage Ibantik]AWN05226.1 hypothetical protein SEA_IBANTIK_1 [Streptomyces phage Ibantik]